MKQANKYVKRNLKKRLKLKSKQREENNKKQNENQDVKCEDFKKTTKVTHPDGRMGQGTHSIKVREASNHRPYGQYRCCHKAACMRCWIGVIL